MMGAGMWDTSNQFVGTADASGLLPAILFVLVFVYGFKFVGRARRVTSDRQKQVLLWALGSALFANAVAGGVTYFCINSTSAPWYCLLASISAAAFGVAKKQAREGGRSLRVGSGVKELSW